MARSTLVSSILTRAFAEEIFNKNTDTNNRNILKKCMFPPLLRQSCFLTRGYNPLLILVTKYLFKLSLSNKEKQKITLQGIEFVMC